jgi:hypothetical protein
VIQPCTELNPVVAAGVAHDDGVVAEFAGERIEGGGGILIRRICLADLQSTPGGGGQPDIAVSREQRTGDAIALIAIAFLGSRRGRNVESAFKLIDELERLVAELLKATDTEIGKVR